ncbi:hypothetical protein V5799_024290 [Amblyomma americanum]|uniref:Uncharacterized protein n=1 Tax=Amblyomma americanum TaxID=6943 RepID=A0AAQ4ECH1_AMBAM
MSEARVLPVLKGEIEHGSQPLLDDECSTGNCSRCSDGSHASQTDVTAATLPTESASRGATSKRELRGQKADAVPHPVIEETKRTTLLSSNPTESTDRSRSPVHRSGVAKPKPPAEFAERTPSKRQSRDARCAFRARSVSSGLCGARLRSPSAHRKRHLQESHSTVSCGTLSRTEDFSSSNSGSESTEAINTSRNTLRYLRRTSSTPLETSLGIEECESTHKDVHLQSRSNLQSASGSSPGSTHAESIVDAASLCAGFTDELSAQLLDIGDPWESTSTQQCAGGTKLCQIWPTLELGDKQSRTETRGESDLDERVAAWDPSQEDSYALSAPGQLELLELEPFDPRCPPIPSSPESKPSSAYDPTDTGTRSNLPRFRRALPAVSPDPSWYEDLEWITEVSGKHTSGWVASVGDTVADRTSTGPLPTVDAEARQPGATQAGRPAPAAFGASGTPGAENGAGILLTQNTETPSLATGALIEHVPLTGCKCEDALTELSTSMSLGTPEMRKTSQLQCESFALEDDVSCDSAGLQSCGDDSRGPHCTDNSRSPGSRLQLMAVLDDVADDKNAGRCRRRSESAHWKAP